MRVGGFKSRVGWGTVVDWCTVAQDGVFIKGSG